MTIAKLIFEEFDVVIDCVNKIPVNKIEKLVKKDGCIILLSGLIKEMLQSRSLKKAKVVIGTAKVVSEQMTEISHMYTSGSLRPVIQKVFPIANIQDAYKLVDSGKKVGNIVIAITQ